MVDAVLLPPPGSRPDGLHRAGWWTRQNDRILCTLCPRECLLKEGDRGFCFVRQNLGGEMVLTTYGRSTGFCIDPIEKKPLNHFLPGTAVLSFGTAGCNLGCKFCQNHTISKSREVERLSEQATPEAIAEAAVQTGCRSVAFTYNDPVIWAEYAIDAAAACRDRDIKTIAVTAGYVTDIAREPVFRCFDAANVDLKAFTELFYQHLTLSHLKPVLDTLIWLKHETDTWFEITNLLIPDENDSHDELRRMCDWILDHLGDTVPVHFTAFHPDFRMQDKPRTPHETLITARELAVEAGIRFAYVGNVNDISRQSTWCPGCGELLIERNWHQLGTWNLEGNRCRFCQSEIDGLFEAKPGNWGRKRQPVEMSRFALPVLTHHVSASTSTGGAPVASIDEVFAQGLPLMPNSESTPRPVPSEARTPWTPDAAQQQVILEAAATTVAATVLKQPVNWPDPQLANAAHQVLSGAFVSLKRAGQLRSCMGMQGAPIPLADAIRRASHNAACQDPRFPPISPSELDQLEMEVWLLHGPREVTATGVARIAEVTIGRHGLQVIRGDKRGLLLPGVATDHGWDAETFLDQVCIKAGLPPTSWREDATRLFTFDGECLSSPMTQVLTTVPTPRRHPFSQDQVSELATFCNANLKALLTGGVTSPYLSSVPDGEVQGLVLESNWLGHATPLVQGRLAFKSGMPLQSSLFELVEIMAGRLGRQIGPRQVQGLRSHLLILADTSMHGTTANPQLAGAERHQRAIVVTAGDRFALQWSPGTPPGDLLQLCQDDISLPPATTGLIYSMDGVGTGSRCAMNRVPQAVVTGGARPPGVAGRFYASDAVGLQREVESCFEAAPDAVQAEKGSWPAAMIPHAGLRFSGRIAAATLSSLEIPGRVIVIGPKHTRHGVTWAVSPHDSWALPGGDMAGDPELSRQLADSIPGLELDAEAHREEHAIEVALPLIRHVAPRSRVVGIAIGSGDFDACRQFAHHLSEVLDRCDDEPLLLISSDMNHFATDAENRRLDELALQAMESLDAARLLETVRNHNISMCGVLPAVMVMETLRQRGRLDRSTRTGYATSAEITGDTSRVVGYAGMLLG